MSSNALRLRAMVGLVPVLVMLVALTVAGCGSSENSTEEWTEQPAATPTSMLEYRIDSLTNDNARMRDQLEAVAAENRKLTARNAELETKIAEAAAAPKVEAATATSTGDAASAYEAALSKFKSKDFAGAITDFQALLDGNIEKRYVDNCHYWIGESHYGLRQYSDALKEFKTVLGMTRSEKKADATLMSGNCSAMLGDAAAAREAYEKVVADFPTSPLVDKAKDKLAKLK
jgi:tol-pal system protein YbgF